MSIPTGYWFKQGSPLTPIPLPKTVRLPYLNSRAILPTRHPTSHLGAHHRKGTRSPMSRTGLHRPRLSRTASRRPAPDTRLLLPSPFPTRRWKVHRLSAAHLSSRSPPRLRPLIRASSPRHARGALPRLCRVPRGHRAPGLLPRLTPRRFPFTQRRQRVCAPIPPNGGASPAYGQAAKGNSLQPCRHAGLAQPGPPAPAPWSWSFHRLHPSSQP